MYGVQWSMKNPTDSAICPQPSQSRFQQTSNNLWSLAEFELQNPAEHEAKKQEAINVSICFSKVLQLFSCSVLISTWITVNSVASSGKVQVHQPFEKHIHPILTQDFFKCPRKHYQNIRCFSLPWGRLHAVVLFLYQRRTLCRSAQAAAILNRHSVGDDLSAPEDHWIIPTQDRGPGWGQLLELFVKLGVRPVTKRLK